MFKLRSLLDKANEISLQNTVKLIKSSRALQIIQSRLAYKQQLYTEALLKSNSVNNHAAVDGMPDSLSSYDLLNKLPSQELTGSYSQQQSNYLSEDDNESFVSADSVSIPVLSLSLSLSIAYLEFCSILFYSQLFCCW